MNPSASPVLIVGSVALDSVETPSGHVENALGGAATYAATATSLFAPVRLVGVVGDDFPVEHTQFLEGRGVDLGGLQRIEGGKTFRWKGDYLRDLNQAETHQTQLGVFESFEPHLPGEYADTPFVFLANINPGLQLKVLEAVQSPKLVVCDTMNLWINLARETVLEVLSRADVAVMNDGEAKLLFEQDNVINAGRELLKLGPRVGIIKKGEHGALMFSGDDIFAAPTYPIEEVVDPTGAGDSFAGAFTGFLAQTGDISLENMRRAVVYGACVASTTVQDFSLGALAKLDMAEVERRYKYVQEMTAF
ncbi:sugar kinase [bacterium]|nr:MAG: sugar kinase [bacterium]